MALIVLWAPFSQADASRIYRQIVKWFKDNPRRRVARTDRGKIRRGHIEEDILAWCEDSVKLPPPKKTNLKKAAKKVRTLAKKKAKKS